MTSQILLYFSIILLFAVVCYLGYKLLIYHRTVTSLKQELNNQTLDYHLKRVKELGYDFTIKAGNSVKPASSSSTRKKSAKSKSFADLLAK